MGTHSADIMGTECRLNGIGEWELTSGPLGPFLGLFVSLGAIEFSAATALALHNGLALIAAVPTVDAGSTAHIIALNGACLGAWSRVTVVFCCITFSAPVVVRVHGQYPLSGVIASRALRSNMRAKRDIHASV